MTCRELIDFLADYLDDALSSRQRIVFETHLLVCPACRDYLKTYQHSIRLARKSLCEMEGKTPEEAPEDLIRAVLASRSADPGRPAS
ncbi:MAG: hypothetical protein FLDDKLPJ_01750 [Phycisphaerae bacterium]|nr:hypothetical protein [Phycisphaerae bacterium]